MLNVQLDTPLTTKDVSVVILVVRSVLQQMPLDVCNAKPLSSFLTIHVSANVPTVIRQMTRRLSVSKYNSSRLMAAVVGIMEMVLTLAETISGTLKLRMHRSISLLRSLKQLLEVQELENILETRSDLHGPQMLSDCGRL